MAIQLLSFDIGIKNMAYCFATCSNNNIHIEKLEKIDLNTSKKANIQKLIDNTLEFLEITINELPLQTNEKLVVLIECQMTSIMKCIQTVINTYFKMIGKYEGYTIETIYLSPKHKLNIINTYGDKMASSSYKQNKNDAIYFANYLLENHYKNDKIMEVFKNTKKKDDISDAFLMVIYYYENNIFLSK
jgi:hypothetical protein